MKTSRRMKQGWPFVSRVVANRGRLRHDDLLSEELPEIAVGLEDARALRALHAFLRPMDETLQQRREHDHRQHLPDPQQDVAKRHAAASAGTTGKRPPKRNLSQW
jgi:hypothetical protein